jgi:hypothetical protein
MAEFNICQSMLVNKHGMNAKDAQKLLNDLKRGVSPEKIRDRAQRVRAIADFQAMQRANADALNMSAYENIRNFIFDKGDETDPMDAYKRFMAFMTGSTHEGRTLNSVASAQMSRVAGVYGRVEVNWMRDAGITRTQAHKLLRDESFGKMVVRELFPFDGKQKTQNIYAYKLAKHIAKEKERVVKEANLAGASIPYNEKHVTTQYHDRIKILAFGPTLEDAKANWVRVVSRMIDEEQMINPYATKEEVLGDIFDHITSDPDGMGEKFSLSEVMSHQRSLVFSNADQWLEYNKMFGHEDPMGAIMQGLEMQSDRTVLMQRMGTDPEMVFKKVMSDLRTAYLERAKPGKFFDPGEMEVLDFLVTQGFDENVLLSRFNQINGQAHIVGNPSIAKYSSMVTNFHIMTKMGKAMLASFSDVLIQAMNLHYQGQGFLESYYNVFKQMKRTFPIARDTMPVSERDMFAMLGIGIEGIIGSTVSRYIPVDSYPGKFSKLADSMFFWNGLNMWTNASRDAHSRNLSNWLARNATFTWKDLNPDLKRALKMYGIDSKDWEVISKHGVYDIDHVDPLDNAISNRMQYVTPDKIRRSSRSKRAQSVANKLEIYFVQESRLGVPQVGADDKAWMMRTVKRGSYPGALLEQFWLFRSFGVAIARQMYPRMKQMGIGATLQHLTPAIVLGYASLSAKALAQGREPPDPLDAGVVAKAFMQSGVPGLAGDLIYSNFTQYNSDIIDFAFGPTGGTMKDVLQVFRGLIQGDNEASKAWGAISNNVPFANVFYLEPIVNYGFLYNLQETVNPGYLDRMERAVANLQKTDYIEALRPSSFYE